MAVSLPAIVASLDGTTITEELELDTNPRAVEAMATDRRSLALDNIISNSTDFIFVYWILFE